MTEELEGAVTDVLRAHGDGAVDVAALRVGSLARARTIRRRRTVLAGVAVAGLLVGVGAAVPKGLGIDGTPVIGAASPSGPAGRAPGVALSLPPSDEPGAAVRPDLVAKDPSTLHFDVDTAAIGGTGIWYTNANGAEHAAVWKEHYTAWYNLAQKREDLDVHDRIQGAEHDPAVDTQVFGRPATIFRYPAGFDGKHPVYEITWSPTDGLWAMVRVEADDADAAMKAVFALKLNRSQRCAVPFRMDTLPAGYRWTGCDVGLGPSKPWETGAVTLTDAKGNPVNVAIGFYSSGEPFAANTTVRGRPAQWIEGTPGQFYVPIQDWVNLVISGGSTEARQLAELVDVGANFTDPATWPVRPIG